MSQDQINMILEGRRELRQDIAEIRKENHAEHKALIERIVKLESSVDFVRKACWTIGAGGLIILMKEAFVFLGA